MKCNVYNVFMSKSTYKSIKIFDGLFLILNPKNSPNYQVRIRIPSLNKHIVKSSGTSNLAEAKQFAKGVYQQLDKTKDLSKAPEQQTLTYWSRKYLKSVEDTRSRNEASMKIDYIRLLSKDSGLCSFIGHLDINKITNDHLTQFFKKRDQELLKEKKSPLGNNTKNKYVSILKSLMKFALIENGIQRVPEFITYKNHVKDNPRPSFTFDTKDDEYKRLLKGIRSSIKAKDIVRYHPITDDLYDLVLFLVHGFMRPSVSEVFAITYENIKIINEGGVKALQIQINKGKTGFRISNSTETLVEVFERIKERNRDRKPTDYIFMNDFKNRTTVANIFQKQFQFILQKYNLEKDNFGQIRSLYSCRHLAIQMRLVKSGGKINILWFAKNCGTSVEMIQRFYAKYLPNSSEVIKNLQSFADK